MVPLQNLQDKFLEKLDFLARKQSTELLTNTVNTNEFTSSSPNLDNRVGASTGVGIMEQAFML